MNLPLKFIVPILASLLSVGCAINSGVIPIGNDQYLITRQAATGFTGTGALKAKAIKEASAYCDNVGKDLKIIAITESQPPYILGNFPKAELVFKAVDSGTIASSEELIVDPYHPQIKMATQSKKQDWKIKRYSYDAETQRGSITIDIEGKGIEARRWAVEHIGEICSDKNLTMVAGKESHKDGGYRVLNESVTNNSLTIEFQAVY